MKPFACGFHGTDGLQKLFLKLFLQKSHKIKEEAVTKFVSTFQSSFIQMASVVLKINEMLLKQRS